ncbi:hypothetical protein GW17_00039108 [Ensete ventricosum]|nr:hypothetical protein GW17_00039108 [Ensete ventricosum]RZS08700.1 hypothetical protein BHM03_00039711 [Ensete ventricosum]
MHRDLPPRHRGSRCNLHAPPSFTITAPQPPLPLRRRRLLFAAGTSTGGRPCRRYSEISYIPVFQIRMEKMKEVKCPPL